METGNALVTVNGSLEVSGFGDLLDGEIVAYGACAVPHKKVNGTQGVGISNDIVEEVIASFLAYAQRKHGMERDGGVQKYLEHGGGAQI